MKPHVRIVVGMNGNGQTWYTLAKWKTIDADIERTLKILTKDHVDVDSKVELRVMTTLTLGSKDYAHAKPRKRR